MGHLRAFHSIKENPFFTQKGISGTLKMHKMISLYNERFQSETDMQKFP